jgi:hypothetical protein
MDESIAWRQDISVALEEALRERTLFFLHFLNPG